MDSSYDIVIVGSGPAGLSAAMNAKSRGKKLIVISEDMGSDKVMRSHRIDNYLGFSAISGPDLNKRFLDSAIERGIEIKEAKVKAIYAMPNNFFLELADSNMIEAKAVILATGVKTKNELVGEKKHLGHGVSYCATCDANLYKNKDVIVIGYNEESIHEVNFIAQVAANTTFVNLYDSAVKVNDGIKVIYDKPKSIEKGDKMVFKTDVTSYEADGIFIIRDSNSAADMVMGLEVDEKNHVKVDSNFQTNLNGLFACGDITGTPYQISRAVGQGQLAALEAVKFLSE